MADWDKAKAQALKALGDGSEVPDLPDSILKASKAFGEAETTFKTSREECEAKLLDIDNANAAFLNALQQFRVRIEKNDFKLDTKKDAKKIQTAQKLLTGELDSAIKGLQQNDKVLDELDKHMIQLGKYKQSTSSI
jgi:predicted  nucleic acid-binding Zn-ribbon protein